jgi:glutamyl-tRNA synthetase
MLSLLGWHPSDDREIFSMSELIEAFSLERVNKSGARFDPDKARWFNQHYLKEADNYSLADLFTPVLISKGIKTDRETVAKIVGFVKERAVFISDLWEQSSFFFVAPLTYDEKAVKKNWKDDAPELMKNLYNQLVMIEDFSSENTELIIKNWITENELPMGKLMNAFRLCVVGESRGPHMFDIISIIGKDETLQRIEKGIATII